VLVNLYGENANKIQSNIIIEFVEKENKEDAIEPSISTKTIRVT
jgi:hypothetical protein